ncbi:sucrose-phosphate phosphatase [Brunnivagina elsteri]|uniref:sucrose-phosphate phosphatase n=1 Tax=Brunnivagina elsteri CCALA 953 TaxID=987040 RepID=A0A2A2TN12_9CYAN|nr:sucrose-phosphate phosphatase [Calothrix elsteri]PAX59926.1 sucrose-phosphate phosphatase [Calothrix elsteri CCALA 953]
MSQFMFVTDLDNTLVNHGTEDDKALQELNQRLSQHRQEYGSKIVYATGRSSVLYYQLAAEKKLIEPDALVVAVGTEIYINSSDNVDRDWSAQIATGWNRNAVVSITDKFNELKSQPDTEQRPFKVSFFLEESASERILKKIETESQKCGLNIKLIYSSGIDLDIVPRNSDKGQAMQFLRQKWKFVAEQTVACGDSGNDIALFAVGKERGIIVGNARPELIQWHSENPADNRYLAKNTCADGILEGLKHFGFL